MPMPKAGRRTYELYAAYLATKTDDLRLVQSLFGPSFRGPTLDLCGGYGRAAAALQKPNQKWMIVEECQDIIDVGEDFFRERPVKPSFFRHNLEETNQLNLAGEFSLVLLLYNSINELQDFCPSIKLSSQAMGIGSHLLLKCIIHDESYITNKINETRSLYFDINDERVYGNAETWMVGHPNQVITLIFKTETDLPLFDVSWNRWIHSVHDIDRECLRFGLEKVREFHGGEYRLYQKTGPRKILKP